MKKGFTLPELLGITVLLALLMGLAYSVILNIFNEKQEEIDFTRIALIESSALNYVKLRENNYDQNNACLFLKTLVDNNNMPFEISDDYYDRIIKVNASKNYAELLDEGKKCNVGDLEYYAFKCVKREDNNDYEIIDKRFLYYEGNKISKQYDIITGKVKNSTNFDFVINDYSKISTEINKLDNSNTLMEKNNSYFKLTMSISNPNDIVLTLDRLEYANLIFNNSSKTIKSEC